MQDAAEKSAKTQVIKEKKIQEPKNYRIVFLNDNYTTQDFVVEILILIFHLSAEDANRVMMNVHLNGRGSVGCYTLDIAQTKANQVHTIARKNEFPLSCLIEEI